MVKTPNNVNPNNNNNILDHYQSLFSNPYLAAAAAATAYNFNPMLLSQVLAAANYQAATGSNTNGPSSPPPQPQAQPLPGQTQPGRESSPSLANPPCKRARTHETHNNSNKQQQQLTAVDYLSALSSSSSSSYTNPSPPINLAPSLSPADVNNNPYHILQAHLKQVHQLNSGNHLPSVLPPPPQLPTSFKVVH